MFGVLAAGAGLALPLSTVALVALNIAQNGPARPLSLDEILSHEVSPTYEGRTKFAWKGDQGLLASTAFTPTDTAPECLNDVLALRTKADVVRAWRNGSPPELPGQSGPELFDGAVLNRGVLSPASSFITHKLFGPGRRWRGKLFDQGGQGCNRFGGGRKNRFGVTRDEQRALQEQIRADMLERKAEFDPLMRELMEQSPDEARAQSLAAERRAVAADAQARRSELRRRPFEARIGPSRLDGKPALILDYSVGGESAGDALWGRVMGMRDELREVTPGVLVGLGSFQVSGGVRNNAPFVLVRSEAADDDESAQ